MVPKPTLTTSGPMMDNLGSQDSNPRISSCDGFLSPWRCLDDHPEVAAELSDLLQETVPKFWVYQHSLDRKRSSSRVVHDDSAANEGRIKTKRRLQAADPLSIHFQDAIWSTLTAAVASETIAEEERCGSQEIGDSSAAVKASQDAAISGSLVEVNSGGRVFFCFFRPTQAGGKEGCCVLKFVQSRLLCQSEQFANELATYVGVYAPDCRIIRANGCNDEWLALCDASKRIQHECPDLVDELHQSSCALIMQYIPGTSLFSLRLPLDDAIVISKLFGDFGRLFALDMLLGNADRLKCQSLGWRGNPGNILYATDGPGARRLVAIDAVVQRRPPGGLMNSEDTACERCVELTLNDGIFAKSILSEAIAGCSPVEKLLSNHTADAVLSFQQGLRAGLEASVQLKGLFEMIYEVTSEWVNEFIEDIEGTSPKTGRQWSLNSPPPSPFSGIHHLAASLDGGGSPSDFRNTTIRIRRINQEANHDHVVGQKVSKWREVFRCRGEELRKAIEEWQMKRDAIQDEIHGVVSSGEFLAQSCCQRCTLSTGFLDGVHPVVDLYELKVRLEHMLQRLRFLLRGTLTARPTALLPGLFLSGAVEASSIHLLRQLGITHILNATADVLSSDDEHAFKTLRVPLQDDEDEDIAAYFESSGDFIDEALAMGGGVLVHCQEGRSRSCSVVLSWLMTRRKWTLHKALRYVQERHPRAAPNAGYLVQLARLDAQLFGASSLKVKKSKPELKSCPVCHDKVGVSYESLRLHIRLKHPTSRGYLSDNSIIL